MRTVDLRTEAIAEAGRLARARTLLRDGDRRALMDLASDAAWIALTRRPTRRRAVLLWRAALEDQSGRIVESLVVPVVIELAHLPDKAARRQWIRRLLGQIEADVRSRVDEACVNWRESAVHMTDAFTSARLRREEAIAERQSGVDCPAAQPGLFDRRIERTRLMPASAFAESELAAATRLRTIAAQATTTPQPARLVLVLVD